MRNFLFIIYKIVFILIICISNIYADELVIKLIKENPPTQLIRIQGPKNYLMGCQCKMCMGNHLLSQHNVSGSFVGYGLATSGYLAVIGSDQWETLHDNLHNSSTFSSHIPSNFASVSLYTPTPSDVIRAALQEASVTSTDIVYDLGSGDGRVLILASAIYKCKSVGIDIDPLCVKLAKRNVKLNKLEGLIRVYYGDAIRMDWQKYATVVFVYLMPEQSGQLVERLKQLPAGVRVIAHDKSIPGLKFDKTFEVQSEIDHQKHKIFLLTIQKNGV